VNFSKFLVGTTDFPAVNVVGSQIFSMNAPSNPSATNCPIQPLAQPCSWLMHSSIIPGAYTGSFVRLTLIVDFTRGAGRPAFVFHSNDDGSNVQQWTDFNQNPNGVTCSATKTTECVASQSIDPTTNDTIIVVQEAAGDGNVFGLPW